MKEQNWIDHASFDFSGKDLDDLLSQFSAPLRQHSRRVAVCSAIMAECADDFSQPHFVHSAGKKLAEIAHLGGTCHDIGKLLLPALTTDEADYFRHPVLGAELLEQHKEQLLGGEALARTVLDVVRYHHERPDGNGFPEGLRARQIPLTAGICAVANYLDYVIGLQEEPFSDIDGVLKQIKAQSGILFCEAAVTCLEKAWPRLVDRYKKWK